MKIQALSGLLFLLIAANEAKTMEKCELAKILKSHGMDKIHGTKLGDWICMAYHESGFNTHAVGPLNTDGSTDYGIFQINSTYWCSNGKTPSKNLCNKSCDDFTNDDIKDDIDCCKRIAKEPQCMNAWTAWVKNCKGKDLTEWIKDCQL